MATIKRTVNSLLCLLLVASHAHAIEAAPEPAVTIAIAYFDNNTGDSSLDPLRKGLADMLITDLSQVPDFAVVERSRLEDVLKELKLSESRFVDPKTAQKLGKGLAAQYIMTGGYVLNGTAFRIDARVIHVQRGSLWPAKKLTAPETTSSPWRKSWLTR